MSTQSDPKSIQERLDSIEAQIAKLLQPKYEFKLHQHIAREGHVLDVVAFLNELTQQGWIVIEAPAIGRIPHPLGLIEDSTGKPFQVTAVEVMTYRRVD